MTLDKIVDKIQKLKAHMESARKLGSDAEAEAFAAAMARIMDEYEISMTDLELASRDAEEPVAEWRIDYTKHGEPVDPYGNPKGGRVRWKESLASIISGAHHCTILVHPGSSRITLVGRASDCAVAEFMIITLTRSVHKMALQAWWKEWRKRGGAESYARNRVVRGELLGFRPAYQNAFVSRLAERYRDERRATEQQTSAGTSTALVRLNQKDAAIQDFMGKKSYRQVAGLTRDVGVSHVEGTRQGRDAADAMALRRTGMKAGTAETPKALRGGR